MSEDDYHVPPLRNSKVREIAKKLRKYYGVDDLERIDVIDCLKRGSILTINGERPLKFEVIQDAEMGRDDGTTGYDGTTIIIKVKRSIHQSAYMGDGRSRNTMAHELGHGAMHYEIMTSGAQLARRSDRNVSPRYFKYYDSAEHQTKVFAPAFLINDVMAQTLESAEEISVRFGISKQSAEIYFAEMIAAAERPKQRAIVQKKLQRLADTLRNNSAPSITKIQYMNDPCTVCGKQQVFPIGHKFMCQACDMVYDRFQDGDHAD